MMGSRFYLLIALAVSCHGLPNTAEDDVVPERQTMLLQHRAAFTKMSPTAFISAMTSSGGSEEDCRTFADKTIKDIEATITTTQAEMNIVATGSSCAAMGQDQVQAEKAKVAAAKTAVQNAETDAASKNTAKEAAASATYKVTFDLTSTQAPTCLDVTGQSSYLTVKALADSAKSAADTADTALADAKTAVTAAEAALANAVDEASRLESACLCRAHKEQKAAMAAASTATAAHAADWKQAHELICALDKTTTCTVPTCPTVTQQTLAAGVATADTEHCLPEPTHTWWGIKWFKVQVQGSMMSNDNLKAACTAKHPNLRPVCDSRHADNLPLGVDSTGKQRCVYIANHNRYWSFPSHCAQSGMTFATGIYWSTGRESMPPNYNTGDNRPRVTTGSRPATAVEQNGYTYCTNIAEDTVPLKCLSYYNSAQLSGSVCDVVPR